MKTKLKMKQVNKTQNEVVNAMENTLKELNEGKFTIQF